MWSQTTSSWSSKHTSSCDEKDKRKEGKDKREHMKRHKDHDYRFYHDDECEPEAPRSKSHTYAGSTEVGYPVSATSSSWMDTAGSPMPTTMMTTVTDWSGNGGATSSAADAM